MKTTRVRATSGAAYKIEQKIGKPETVDASAEPSQQTAPPPKPAATSDELTALRQLLHIEGDLAKVQTLDELSLMAANDFGRMLGSRLCFFVDLLRHSAHIVATSGQRNVDRNAPFIRWIESCFQQIAAGEEASKAHKGELPAAEAETATAFPFPHYIWLPLAASADRRAVVVAVSEREPLASAVTIAERLSLTGSRTFERVTGPRSGRKLRLPKKHLLLAGILVLAAAALLIKVPMTAIAPAEVVARNAFVVAAPVEGVIEKIVVPPNAVVAQGDTLATYYDTVQRNQMAIAEKEFGVAEAALRQIQQAIFIDEKAKRDLLKARADVQVKAAELAFARETYEHTKIRAARPGVAVYADPKDWVGKPVNVGQRILEVADLASVILRVDLPISDALVIRDGARVRLFLDGNPSQPLEATVTSAAHQARMVEGLGMAYRVEAAFPEGVTPRLGLRGSAQVFSDSVPLAFYLFRRPISYLRQKVGF